MASADAGGGITKELTGDEVQRMSGGCGVTRYPDLEAYETWEAFMAAVNQKAAVLFCTDSPTDGHWLAAFQNKKDGPHVFDPLGIALDAERSVIGGKASDALNEDTPQFKRLLQGQKCHVSRFHYQSDKPGVNTCGRWTALRLLCADMTDPEFHDEVMGEFKASGLPTLDDWIVARFKAGA